VIWEDITVDDYAQIQQLYSRYNLTLDEKRQDDWLDCFTSDGAVEGANFGRFVGREQLKHFLAKYRADTHMFQMRHVVTNMLLDIQGDNARGSCYILHYRTHRGHTELIAIGRYDDQLRKVDGKWLLAERKAFWDYSGSPA
jgi:3-phenylpropionate/cinnamic acid dioxygenase small subunit